MKIYTRTGDKGQTSLLSGNRVSKSHPRIEAYGTVDELNSFIGLLLAFDFSQEDKILLTKLQSRLFTVGSLLAMDENKPGIELESISNSEIIEVEKEIDRLSGVMPKLKKFIIPGGSQAIATAHLCRTVCRRAERICVNLADNENIDTNIIIYLNRLSDYFFILARKIAFDQNIEIPTWSGK